MIPVVGSTPPALDAGHELSEILQHRSTDALFRREPDGHQLRLGVALSELEAWLNDPRPYKKKHHQYPWQTMADDVTAALAARGKLTRKQTPTIESLLQQLQVRGLGDDPPLRAACKRLIQTSRTELAQSSSVAAAFDDLLDATKDLGSSPARLLELTNILEDCLRAAGRTVSSSLDSLAGVLGNNLWRVKLDGMSRPEASLAIGRGLPGRLRLVR